MKPVIHSQTNVSEDHIIFDLKIGFRLSNKEMFSDGISKLIETISYGGKGEFQSERKGARYHHEVKVISIDDDPFIKGDEATGRIQIAIPIKLCTVKQGIPQILASIMYASVYSFVCEYQVSSISLPDAYLKHLPKPKYGTEIFQDKSSELMIGLILKPRSILNPDIAKKLIHKAGKAGIDYIADDELTIDPPEWSFVERISFIASILKELEKDTGRKIKYIANISGSYEASMKLARVAQKFNIDGVMVNTITMGYDVVQSLASKKSFKPFIVANVIGRNLMAGGPKYLIADHLHSFLARISGADAVYTGPFIGSLKSRHEKASHFTWALTGTISKKYPIKASYAVMSGGLEPKNLLENYRIYSNPTMFSIGLSFCNLIEQDVSIEKVLNIIRTVFEAEKKGGEKRVKEEITQLAVDNKEYLDLLTKLGWT